MADSAPEVKIKLTAEDQGVAAAIKALGSQLQELKQKGTDVSSTFEGLKSAFEGLIGAETIYKIAEFGKEVFNASVGIERMSQRTGLSAGLLSTFAKAAESSGVSSEQMNNSLGRLATSITKFQQGGTEASAAMKELGITQAQLAKLSPDEKIRLVTDRLGKMQDGLQKAAIAQALMGRGGQALIPVMNSLAGEGFDEVTKAAIRSGQYLSDDMAADAATAAAALAELEGAGKGIATQFEAGLIPAVTDVAVALTDSIEGDGVGALRKIGEQTGLVVKDLILGFEMASTAIGLVFMNVLDIVDAVFRQVGNGVGTLATAAFDAATGQFKAAGQAIANGVRNGVGQARVSIDQLTSAWTAATTLMKSQADALFPSDAKKASLRPKAAPAGKDKDDDSKNDKARTSLLEARLQNELALFKANNSAEEEANQVAYDQGLESLKTYYEKKKALAMAESAEQISVLTRQRATVAAAPTDSTADATAKAQKIEKLDNEIAVAKVQATTKQAQLGQGLFAAEEEHQKKLLGYQAQILTLQGLTYASAIASIQGEAAEIKRGLEQSGLSPQAVDAMLGKIQELKLATAAFDEDKKQGNDALKSLDAGREDINLQVTAGLETQYGAEQKIAQLELSRVPQLQKIADAMKAAAVTPEQVQEADDFAQKIKGIQVAATATANTMQQFAKQSGTAVQGDLNTFLTQTLMTAKGIGSAFRQLAASVVGSIQKIVTQLLIQIITEKLLQTIKKGGSGTSQVATAAAAGIAQATPLITASTAMSAAGVTIGTGATALGLSAAALQSAADALIVANSMGGGAGYAEGGSVVGPGTGTSDSIPARLSHGEFVVSAAAAHDFGHARLAAINRGVRIPSVNGLGSTPRFAEGGLVQTGIGSNGVRVDMNLDLAEGLVLKHLSTPKAGKIVVNHVSSNPRAVQKAIQRGG